MRSRPSAPLDERPLLDRPEVTAVRRAGPVVEVAR